MPEDLRRFFQRYAEHYMAGDADVVASEMYAAPFLAVRDGSPIHLADREAVRDHLTGLMAAYQASGAAVAEIAGLDVMAQGDSAACVTIHWAIRSATGQIVRDLHTTYQLTGPEPWLIHSYVNHDTSPTR
ncbi:MAG TPA: hypothetical protein VFK38_02930 [Candidatus Limnocylindrales bacterium]|nr:hypothetical protein [Candidatus Limnocylindrales bacterium]